MILNTFLFTDFKKRNKRMTTEAFDTVQGREPGVATHVDFALRRVNISHALDPAYNPKLTGVLLFSLYAAAIASCRFEGHIVGRLAPMLIASLLISVPLFLYSGGTIMKRGNNDQTKWALQCWVVDPIVELYGVAVRRPIASFIFISLIAELSKLFGSSLWALAIGATLLVAFRYYELKRLRK